MKPLLILLACLGLTGCDDSPSLPNTPETRRALVIKQLKTEDVQSLTAAGFLSSTYHYLARTADGSVYYVYTYGPDRLYVCERVFAPQKP